MERLEIANLQETEFKNEPQKARTSAEKTAAPAVKGTAKDIVLGLIALASASVAGIALHKSASTAKELKDITSKIDDAAKENKELKEQVKNATERLEQAVKGLDTKTEVPASNTQTSRPTKPNYTAHRSSHTSSGRIYENNGAASRTEIVGKDNGYKNNLHETNKPLFVSEISGSDSSNMHRRKPVKKLTPTEIKADIERQCSKPTDYKKVIDDNTSKPWSVERELDYEQELKEAVSREIKDKIEAQCSKPTDFQAYSNSLVLEKPSVEKTLKDEERIQSAFDKHPIRAFYYEKKGIARHFVNKKIKEPVKTAYLDKKAKVKLFVNKRLYAVKSFFSRKSA